MNGWSYLAIRWKERFLRIPAITYAKPVPAACDPTELAGEGGTACTITGTNLGAVTAVNFSGTPATRVVAVNDSTVTCIAPAHAPGLVNIWTRGLGGDGLLVDAATYVPHYPEITGVSPTSGPAAGGTAVTLTGTNFAYVTQVRIIGLSGPVDVAFTIDSDTQITITAMPDHDLGDVNIQMFNAGGFWTALNAFTYVATEPLTVTACSPTHAAYTATTPLTLTGTGFHGVIDVEIQPYLVGVSFTVIDDETITLDFDGTSLLAQPGDLVSFKVSRSLTDSVISADLFTADYPTPVFTSWDVATGSTAGGDSRTITGTGFTGATGGTLDGNALTSFVVVDDTTITCDTPAGAAGAVDLVIANPQFDSGSSGAASFTYQIPVPTVVGISPSSGLPGGGDHVVIEVDDSTGCTSAALDGSDLTGFAIDDATHVSGDTPAHADGAVDVTVTNTTGTSSPLAAGFTYVAPYDFGSLDYTLLLFSEDYIYGTAAFGGTGGATAGEWLGTASAGTSGSNSITRTATAPTVGANLGTFATVDFNGTTQHLNGAALSTYVTANIESGWILLNIDSINAGSTFNGGGEWQDVQVVGNASGYWGVALYATGPQVAAWHYATATYEAIATSAWKLVRWRRVSIGSDLEIGVNSGAMQTAASNAIGDLTAILRVGGAGTSSDYHFDGRIAAMGLSKTAFLDGDFDDIRAGLEAKYGISLA